MPRTTATTTTQKRQSYTPAERAQQKLDVENRRVAKLEKKRDSLKAELDGVKGELEAAEKRRNYLRQNPDLPEQPADYDALIGDDPDES